MEQKKELTVLSELSTISIKNFPNLNEEDYEQTLTLLPGCSEEVRNSVDNEEINSERDDNRA